MKVENCYGQTHLCLWNGQLAHLEGNYQNNFMLG